ncbi:MAG TPA: hypothetical protein VMW24_21555, partial [Sedimentisphaerales bacterium]|nr:hypothetical protein [Sedimentisphaerales bacterium]
MKGNEHTAEKTRLYILLMLNCGFQQSDVADIRQNEVDWEKGRIKRPRNKTKKRKNAQLVDYKLWGDTLALLKKYRSEHPERVLINEKGKALWRQR